MKFFIAFTWLFLTFEMKALEIDEKLTTRFLKVSQSRKTVLINRGLEDGLVVGDHAKFFLTAGVIARGVVVKASPTRSIWSIYRIIDGESLFPDRVVNIKITRALQMTDDPSKSLYDNSHGTMSAGSEKMSLGIARGEVPKGMGRATGKVQTMKDLSADERRELGSFNNLDEEAQDRSGVDITKMVECYGLVHLNLLGTTVDEGKSGSFTSGDSTIDFSLGVEKTFALSQGILKKLGFFALVHSSSDQNSSVRGTQVSHSGLEFGGGVNYYFAAAPLSYRRLIYYGGFSFGIGSVSDKVEVLTANSTQASTESEGSSSFISLSVGAKYYTRSGFGGRVVLDYYRRSEDYEKGENDSYSKVVAGPRLLLGLGYRF